MNFGSGARRLDLATRRLHKRLLPLGIAVACLFLVLHRLEDVHLGDVAAAIGAVTPGQWALAILATALSFAAVGQYDALFHRWLRTGVTAWRAVVSGAGAIALAQTLGLGLATGTLARWRMLPELTIPTALKVTNYVSFSFMAGLGLLSVMVLALPGAVGFGAPFWSLAAALLAGTAMAISILQPGWLPFRLPPLRMAARLMGLITLDVVTAAMAFWVLLPVELQPAFPLLLSVFTLSLGAGLISGSPGGVGPFELCLVTLLPVIPEPDLIAAILAFRLVYYALPACLGLLLLAHPRPAERRARGVAPLPRPSDFIRAEALLSDQPGHRLVPTGDGTCLHVAEASQTLVAIGDSVTGGALTTSAFTALERAASDGSRWPVFYKCSALTAGTARKRGWSVLPISEEAWIDPARFTLDNPQRRQLRRKLKAAEREGVTITMADPLPLQEMEVVARDWAGRMGGERGFSMGRFCREHLARQRCYLAYANGRLVAFASFHTVGREWTLDLMRSRSDMPNGTMHALIHAAIRDAARAGVPRLSLAAIVLEDGHKLLKLLWTSGSAKGLRRFKESFAPRRQRLYAAAPNRAILVLAGLDLFLRINSPTPPPRESTSASTLGVTSN